ncbi:hypothetical protein M8C21_017484 [Ambrosia artemisiifolia]|uniref:DUF7950 domain-containing protein n=1 Tax=Ambrosia artemisiifolia TaxID=4212 RepID=A0AAD5BWY3_AMBAR|nr:hypothetical protein M8C21_017484 [Ambrosia artemisiifolia]
MGGGKRRIETGYCDNGSGFDPKDKMIINQIMLRYRPIAPRPVSVDSSVSLVPVKVKRAKRKYVRVKKKNKKVGEECNLLKDDKGWMSLDQTVSFRFVTVTDPVQKVSVPDQFISFDVSENNNKMSRWITPARPSVGLHDVDLEKRMTSRPLVESWVTMESVIGTCEDENPLQYTDMEIWKNLEADSCPGFISSSNDEVQWVNLAYRRMVDPNNTENKGVTGAQVVVWLGIKVEKSAFKYWQAFSCRVRVVYMLSEKEKEKKKQITVPCDVWKMDSGGYAWRLDVKAALSLGRYSQMMWSENLNEESDVISFKHK